MLYRTKYISFARCPDKFTIFRFCSNVNKLLLFVGCFASNDCRAHHVAGSNLWGLSKIWKYLLTDFRVLTSYSINILFHPSNCAQLVFITESSSSHLIWKLEPDFPQNSAALKFIYCDTFATWQIRWARASAREDIKVFLLWKRFFPWKISFNLAYIIPLFSPVQHIFILFSTPSCSSWEYHNAVDSTRWRKIGSAHGEHTQVVDVTG